MRSHRIAFAASVFSLSLILLAGCGQSGPDYGSLNLSDVSGTVTLDGKPLAKALVLFEADDQTFSCGLTDDSGNYSLMFNSEQSGITKGPKTVRIWSSRGIPGASEAGSAGEEEGDPDAPVDKDEKVPVKYNEQSELKRTVEKDTETFDFEL